MIEWKSVYDELPKNGVQVLAIVKDSDIVFTMKFDPTYGWTAVTELRRYDMSSCPSPYGVNVMFWAIYNLPK